jgi:hypothetical protein
MRHDREQERHRVDEDSDKEDEIIQRFGLHPAKEDLDAIRAIITEQTTLGLDAHIELMRICCVMLFNAGHAIDSLLIWRAKESGWDAHCSIDVQLLCGAGLSQTMAYLEAKASREPEAAEALTYLRDCAQPGVDFDGFTPEARSALYDRYYLPDSAG